MKIRLFPEPVVTSPEVAEQRQKMRRYRYTFIGAMVLAFLGYRIVDREQSRRRRKNAF